MATPLLDQATAELGELEGSRMQKAQLYAALIMTAVEYGVAGLLIMHGEWIDLFLAVTYYVRETRGGAKYHAWLTRAILRRRRKGSPVTSADLKRMRHQWVASANEVYKR